MQLGEVKWVVKNPETTKYYNFEDDEWGLIALFDGTRTLAEVQAEYQARFPREPVEMSLVVEYDEMLRVDGPARPDGRRRRTSTLLAKARGARQRAAEEKAEGFNPFFLLFHVLDPNRFLDRTVKYVRWIWTPAGRGRRPRLRRLGLRGHR